MMRTAGRGVFLGVWDMRGDSFGFFVFWWEKGHYGCGGMALGACGGVALGPLRQSGVPSSPRSRSAKERSGR